MLCWYNKILIHSADAFFVTTTRTSIPSTLRPSTQFSESFDTKLYLGTDTEPKTSTPATESVNGNNNNSNDDERLGQKFGGYTVKQRLREEVESPFRKVRFFFFLGSTGSAFIALYFSALSALKASMGGYTDAMPMDEALQNCGINLGGVLLCGYLAFRDYQAGQANLQRIAKGGQLARLAINPASKDMERSIRTLSEYRRASRVLICAGGETYIQNVCRALNADQLKDTNNLPELLEQVDVIIVPVLLSNSGSSSKMSVGDTKLCWRETESTLESERNFDSTRSDNVVGFPRGNSAWEQYLESEIDTAIKQGFDVVEKGFTITIKKNGKVLRRATGSPSWGDLIGAMEVLDGSKFGMPGDSERYGGP